jgi:serine protease Do
LKSGDVLIGMNGENFTDYNELRLAIAQAAPNTTIHLKISRNGTQMDVPVTLAEQPANLNAAPSDDNDGGNQDSGNGVQGVGVMSGVQVEDLTPQIARQHGVSPSMQGVIVSQVAPDSAAAQSGLASGDVIVEVNRHPVHNTQEYKQVLSQGSKDSALLLINHQGAMAYIAVQPQQ